VLFASGTADPFARIDLLRDAIDRQLPDAELATWDRIGHSLSPVLDDVLEVVAAFVRRVAGA
jgi:hypothetical protein